MADDPDRISAAATKAELDVLDALRKEVVSAILAAPEPLSTSYRALLGEVERLMSSWESGMLRTQREHLDQAALAGDEEALDALKRASIQVPMSFVGVSPELVRVAAEYNADLITGLSAEAINRITREVRLAALGGKSTIDLINVIGRNLDSPSVFRTIGVRAEMIARTEVSRVYSMAHFEQGEQIAARFSGVRKTWLHSTAAPGATMFQAKRARPNHVALSGTTIPYAEDFNLGKNITAPHPHHWSLPASETVGCRCRLTLDMSQVDATEGLL